jgi:hypothetical protein
MGNKKHESPFTGRWEIVSMDAWDVDYMAEEGPAFIEADEVGIAATEQGGHHEARHAWRKDRSEIDRCRTHLAS